ncbi:MAG: hypothetical protein IJ714_08285 [Bacteroidales bacterium]|nr:hypothetical protein [Bacteroidales bacterium]
MKLNREILRLAGPSILANITVPLVGMVDIAVVGHLGTTGGVSGAALIGGISVGTMLFDLLYWNFGFLRAGTGGLTAQAYGRLNAGGPGTASGARSAQNAPEIVSILGRALRIAALSGLALVALQWVVVQLAFLVVQCSPEVRTLATQYFFIRIWAAPATLSLFAFKGWFIGLQDSLSPMLVDLWVNGVNILLSVLLAFGLALPAGSTLAALGSGIMAPAGGTLAALGSGIVTPAGSTLAALGSGIVTSAGGILAALGSGIVAPAGGVLVPGLGFAGVAWGTVIAQWTGLLLALLVARKHLSLSHLLKILCAFCAEDYTENTDNQKVTGHPSSGATAKVPIPGAPEAPETPNTPNTPETPKVPEAPEAPASATSSPAAISSVHRPSFFTLNRDLFLRSVGMIAVYIGFTVLSARLGDLMLAVSTILMKFLMVFSYFTDGFAYAGEALTGRFIGERSTDGVRSTVRGTFAWGFGLAAAFMLVYGLGGMPLFRLMTSDNSVVEAGRQFIPWLLLMPLIGYPAFIWDGIFIGATASKDLRNSTLLCAVGFFAMWFAGRWLADAFNAGSVGSPSPETALHILMAAYFTHLAIRTLYLTLRYKPAVLRPLI